MQYTDRKNTPGYERLKTLPPRSGLTMTPAEEMLVGAYEEESDTLTVDPSQYPDDNTDRFEDD